MRSQNRKTEKEPPGAPRRSKASKGFNPHSPDDALISATSAAIQI